MKFNEHERTAKGSVVGGTGARHDIVEWVLAKVGPECELTFLRIHLQCRQFDSWVREICWRRDSLPTEVLLGFLVAQLVKNPPAVWRPRFSSWVGKIPWRRKRLPTPVFWPGESHGLWVVHDWATFTLFHFILASSLLVWDKKIMKSWSWKRDTEKMRESTCTV